ncbi:MAG: hypothetical protein R2860_14455 [Desulfobacterales bacterium]
MGPAAADRGSDRHDRRGRSRNSGEERAKKASMKYRIIMDKHAMNNKAHRRLGLEFDQADDLMTSSPALVGELVISMCSQSDGACAMIFASEEKPNSSASSRHGSKTTLRFTGRKVSASSATPLVVHSSPVRGGKAL